jgi:hypothetical protein
VTLTSANGVYAADRYESYAVTDGTMTAQQVADAPTGFTYSLKHTTTVADASLSASQRAQLAQKIEGFNIADLAFGTANAATVTVSFWVKSSLTGTFGGSLCNGAYNRSYPFSYTISSANTWEKKSVTITGDTSGSWDAGNGRGIVVYFGLGLGSDFSGTANTWQAGEKIAPTGSVSVIGTLNATFYITGVQLEAGSVATPFERRPFGTELALCQRYFQTIIGTASTNDFVASGFTGPNQFNGGAILKTSMRAAPTISISGSISNLNYTHPAIAATVSSIASTFSSTESYAIVANSVAATTNGFGAYLRVVATGTAVQFSSEL